MHRSLFLLLLAASPVLAGVKVLQVPDKGVQPQVLVDRQGRLHLIYLAGPAPTSDVFHRVLDATTLTFGEAARINHKPGNAMAVGSIRGAQCALGKDDRLHVVWNGSGKGPDGKPQAEVLYTHSDGRGGYEPERGLMTTGKHLDGGATVAADATGMVHVLWHAAPLETPQGSGEGARRVYMTSSKDDGQSFEKEQLCAGVSPGVCACCSIRAQVMAGELVALYRIASGNNRGIQLLRRGRGADSFVRQEVQDWPIKMCPMSSSCLLAGKQSLAAWETGGEVWMASLDQLSAPTKIGSANAKHPSLAQSPEGDILVTWAMNTGWQRGGQAAWSLRSAKGHVIEEGPADRSVLKVPVWSFPAAAYVPGLGFVVVH
jgi:hypothetical protein